MEAGNRCFNQRVPEELNRKIVDHLSDINMPLTEQARDYLIAEGIRPETVIKTGSCMKEILLYYKDKIDSSSILNKLQVKKGSYFIVSSHREENVDYKENLTSFIESLNEVVKTFSLPIIVSTHPRTRQRIKNLEGVKIDNKIKFLKPLGFFDYVNLQQNSKCVISDSGTISEESSILVFPAIMIRAAHERPEGMDEGSVVMSGLEKNRIIESVNMVTKQFESGKNPRIVSDYDVDNVSLKVSRIIMSYIDYINRTVWKKDSYTRMA
jgi:UDP-N-acetylglucosamine 2-epimerase (non-hydrolysing)